MNIEKLKKYVIKEVSKLEISDKYYDSYFGDLEHLPYLSRNKKSVSAEINGFFEIPALSDKDLQFFGDIDFSYNGFYYDISYEYFSNTYWGSKEIIN